MSVIVRVLLEGWCFSRCRHTSSGKHGGGGGGREDTVEISHENTDGFGKSDKDGDAEGEQNFSKVLSLCSFIQMESWLSSNIGMKELHINKIPSGTEEVGSAEEEEETGLGDGGGEGPHGKKLHLTEEQSHLLGEF
uniref:Uncharacterized protein n=1 Tax=Nelumbo nucifera TaxID=4432 RepID=A0A822XQU9_NELNU|nr:TPA_asm: hypothetical protein HUJ06_025447 [Nelumbo nucifera]